MNIQSLYPIFKTIHILSMSSSIVIMIVGELLLLSGGYLQSAPALYRGSHRLSGLSEKLGLIGLIAGAATALTGGWGLLAPWLILAYALIVLTFVLGKMFVMPWEKRVETVMANPDGVQVAALQHILRERRAILGRWLVVLVFIGIVMVMRTKPSIVIVPSVASAANITEVDDTRLDEPSVIADLSPQADVAYTLETEMSGSGLAFRGVGGAIEGITNPNLTATVGDSVSITLINGHAMPHDLTIENLAIATQRLNAAGDQATLTFTATAAGDYIYYCSFPGHRSAGMWGILRVNAA